MKTLTNPRGMTFVFIAPVTFSMGSRDDERGRYHDEGQHQVNLARGFHIQTTPVTQAQWTCIMGENPSYFKTEGHERPVENVSWYDCQDFVRRLNEKEETDRYRLPLEAEWECACRSGSDTRFCFGNEDSSLDHYGWYYGNSDLEPHPVGRKRPNAWGIYDMHGNVWEWCQDWYGPYPAHGVQDPAGPPEGSYKVVRGGGWYFYPESCRSSCRNAYQPGYKEFFLGLRLIREP